MDIIEGNDITEEKIGWKKIKLIYKNKKPYSYKIEKTLDVL